MIARRIATRQRPGQALRGDFAAALAALDELAAPLHRHLHVILDRGRECIESVAAGWDGVWTMQAK